MQKLIAILGLSLSMAVQAACLPPGMGKIASGSNTKGDWIGWWCAGSDVPYIAACPKSVCSLVGSKRAVSDWLNNPSLDALTFGKNPHTDSVLRAVWEPERAKLDKLR